MVAKERTLRGASSEHNATDTTSLLYALSVLPLAFDFRSEGSGAGAAVQGALLASYLGLSVLFLLRSRDLAKIDLSIVPALIVSWFCLVGGFVGYARNQEIYAIFTSTVPIGLFALSSYLTARAVQSASHPHSLLRFLKWLCLIYLISRFMIVAISMGVDLNTVRYQILSGSIIAALGLIPLQFFLRTTITDFAVIVASLSLVLLSVTRSELLIAATQFLIYLKTPLVVFRRKVITRTTLALTLLLGLIGTDLLLELGLTDRWITRLLASQEFVVDPTLLTRTAEVEFMTDAFTGGPTELLFGNGIAARTSLIGAGAGMAAALVGRDSVAGVHSIGFGHNNYVSILFVAGLFGGLPLLALLLWQTLDAVSFFGSYQKEPSARKGVLELGMWGATIILGTMTFGFLGGTFGDRQISLWYGIGTGLLSGSKAALRALQRKQAHRILAK